MSGRVVVVTGGNSGIGKEAAVALAGFGATVVFTARDAGKGQRALTEIRTRSQGARVEVMPLDLASFASVRAFAREFCDRFDRLDVLLNNAGLTLSRRAVTEEGFEATFGVNHVGHFLLTSLLRDRLAASAPARVVIVASDAHRFAVRGLDFDDLQLERRYSGWRAYCRPKLANVLFTRELARRLDGTGVTANALHPGFVATNFGREGDTGRLAAAFAPLLRPFALSPTRGARTSIFLASSPAAANITGGYFVRGRQRGPSLAARDDAAAARLWDVSEALVRDAAT